MASDAVVQDERDQQLLHVMLRHVQVRAHKGDADARVRLDQLQHHLRGATPAQAGRKRTRNCATRSITGHACMAACAQPSQAMGALMLAVSAVSYQLSLRVRSTKYTCKQWWRQCRKVCV